MADRSCEQSEFDMGTRYSILLVGLLIVHLMLLCLCVKGNLNFFFSAAMHRIGQGTDFAAYYNATRNWLNGNGIYGHPPGFGYRYHPVFAMLMALPIILIRKGFTVYLMWVILNEILVISWLYTLRKFIKDIKGYIGFCALLFFFSPYFLEVYMGNSSFVVAALMFIAFYYYTKHAYWQFAVLLITSIIIKPISLVFLPILLMRKQFKLTLIVCAIVVALALPYFFRHPDEWLIFINVNFLTEAPQGWLVLAGNEGFHSLLVNIGARLSGISLNELSSYTQLPGFFRALLLLLPILFVLLTLWQTHRLRNNVYVCVFLWSATYLLAYKDVWEHSYSFLSLGLLFLYLSNYINKRIVVICALGLALPTAFWLYDVHLPLGPYDPEPYWGLGISMLHHATKPIWLLILYLACLWKTCRSVTVRKQVDGQEHVTDTCWS